MLKHSEILWINLFHNKIGEWVAEHFIMELTKDKTAKSLQALPQANHGNKSIKYMDRKEL